MSMSCFVPFFPIFISNGAFRMALPQLELSKRKLRPKIKTKNGEAASLWATYIEAVSEWWDGVNQHANKNYYPSSWESDAPTIKVLKTRSLSCLNLGIRIYSLKTNGIISHSFSLLFMVSRKKRHNTNAKSWALLVASYIGCLCPLNLKALFRDATVLLCAKMSQLQD